MHVENNNTKGISFGTVVINTGKTDNEKVVLLPNSEMEIVLS